MADSQADGTQNRKIVHLDMDCFYAAVEVRENPALKGKALGIGGPPNSRSVLTTASYEARKFGCHSAMPSSQAVRLCPHIILLPPRMSFYKEESREVFKIFSRFTDKIEPLSLDEAYLDITESVKQPGDATKIAQEIRRLVLAERRLTVSAGVSFNKFLAKIASDWKKPNGIFVIPPEKVAAFMPELKIEKIYGVGKVTAKKFHELGLFTCADLQKLELVEMKRLFGSRALDLYGLCRGEDHRPVDNTSERKSFTVEETYSTDFTNFEEALPAMRELYQSWETRFLKKRGPQPEGAPSMSELIDGYVVKIKFSDFQGTTHEKKGKHFPSEDVFIDLFRSAWKRSESRSVRLLGLGVKMKSEADVVPQLEFAI